VTGPPTALIVAVAVVVYGAGLCLAWFVFRAIWRRGGREVWREGIAVAGAAMFAAGYFLDLERQTRGPLLVIGAALLVAGLLAVLRARR
jgi:hypothetical protein